MKKILSSFLVLCLVLFTFVGCGKTQPEKKDAPKDAKKAVKVGLVSSSSGFGDGAFNDLTLKGVDKAKTELGISYDKVQIKAVGDIELSLREMAQTKEYDLIMALTYEAIEAMKKVSAEFPDQKFAIIDTKVEAPNVASYLTKDEEGSYLVGVAAANMKLEAEKYGLNKEKKIGFVGGVDAPNIRIFYAGYTAGAKTVDKGFETVADFVGSFTDVTTAKEIANSMKQHKVDLVYQVAGMSGNGVFQSAKENKTKAFGVNLNQNKVEPDCIPASMIKNVDVEAFNAIKTVVDGTFKAEVIKLGLKENGVDFVTEGSNVKLSEKTTKAIEEAKAKIISGDIKVPSSMDELSAYEKNLK